MMAMPGVVHGIDAAAVGAASTVTSAANKPIERMNLTVITYDDLLSGSPEAMARLNAALLNDGIVGVTGIDGYTAKVKEFIEAARHFSNLPEGLKETCKPDPTNPKDFLGYEVGKEKFNGIPDYSKESYYAYAPDVDGNHWPDSKVMDLKGPFQAITAEMRKVGYEVMKRVGLTGNGSKSDLANEHVARMLCYRERDSKSSPNPLWCGKHKDHSSFTALLPAFYFKNGQRIAEPEEAGLFVRGANDTQFKKVASDNEEVLLFQVGEWGQLATDDRMKATEHEVHKPVDPTIERYTMAQFFGPTLDCLLESNSEVTQDSRWGGGKACAYKTWHFASIARYKND